MLNKITLTQFNNWVRFISAGLYLTSLTQTSFCTNANCADGLGTVMGGLIGFFTSFAALTWLANPLIYISWVFIDKNPRLSSRSSIAASLISLSFLFFKHLMVDEAGNMSEIISYGLGYWLWVLSSAIMIAGHLYTRTKKSV